MSGTPQLHRGFPLPPTTEHLRRQLHAALDLIVQLQNERDALKEQLEIERREWRLV